MIIYLIAGALGVMVFVALMQRAFKKGGQAASRAKFLLVAIILIGLLLLVITGRLHGLIAGGGALLVLLWRLIGLVKFLPLIRVLPQLYRFWRYRRGRQQNGTRANQQAPPNDVMSKADALKILGLTGNPNRDSILAAHKRLVQKLHPDKGGSNYLATLINSAKDKLLS